MTAVPIRLPRTPAAPDVVPPLNTWVTTYTPPDPALVSQLYSVTAAGRPAWVYPTARSHVTRVDAEWGQGPVLIAITHPDGPSTIGPRHAQVPNAQLAPGLTVALLPGPGHYVLTVGGDRAHPLAIAAGWPSTVPDPAPDLVILGPGIHPGPVDVPPGGGLYVHGSALVTGGAIRMGRDNPKAPRHPGGTVWGRGIIDTTTGGGPGRAFRAYNSDHVELIGVTLISHTHWAVTASASTGVRFAGLQVISHLADGATTGNPDGIDLIACPDFEVTGCYIDSHDDPIAVKWRKNGYAGDTSGTVDRCVIAHGDAGNALEVGYEVAPTPAGVIGPVTFTDTDVLWSGGNPAKPYRRAALGVHNPGPGTIRDVVFDDVRVEDATEAAVYVGSFSTGDYPSTVRGPVDRVTFRGCDLPAGAPVHLVDTGSAPLAGVVFDRCTTGGVSLTPGDVHTTRASTAYTLT